MRKKLNFLMCAAGLMALLLGFLTGGPSYAQGRSSGDSYVHGVVSDATGAPLPGATVQVRGTAGGVITDLDGAYSIKATKGDVLVFSFVGLLSEDVTVGTSSVINVVLQDDSELLDEAVSIGYGTQKRSLVTNSITKVSSKEFERSPQQSIAGQLQGKVPGLSVQITSGQPGEVGQFFIRGGTTTSVTSDTPLIIVDGVVSQSTRSIADMNPADIESVEVLKDAASTAIYGAKAANGIIIITTKSGSKGAPKINFRYTFGVDTQPKRLDLMNAEEYLYTTRKAINEDPNATADVKAKFLSGSYGMSTGNAWDTACTTEYLDTYISKYGQDFVSDLLENKGWQTMRDPVTGQYLIFYDTDFQNATYRNALKHEYAFDVSGGDGRFTYYASLRHLNQEGIVRGVFYKTYDATFNSSYRATDRLLFRSKALINFADKNMMSSSINSLERGMFMPPTYRLYYENGLPAEGEGMSTFRPLEFENYYKTKYRNSNQYRLGMQFGAEWDILPGLKLVPMIYYTSTDGLSDSFEALNATTGTEIRPASEDHNHDHHIQAEAVLNYDKSIKKHHINAVAGTTWSHDYSNHMSGSGSGAPSDLIPTLNATADSTQRVTSTHTNEAMVSYFGRVNYDYDGKYLMSVSMRADGSSRFAENHRWGYFPGVSAGWNVHKEKFFSSMSRWMNKLKLRASYGQAGNNNLSLANTRGQYSVTGTTYLNEVGILNSTLANADLLWETTESYDLGVDMSFWNSRLELIVDVYDKITRDRLYDKQIPTTTGFSSIKTNYGDIGTKGLEIEVHAVPVSTRDFTWNLGFNFNWFRTIVLKLPDNGKEKNRINGKVVYDPVTGQDIEVGGFAEGERFGTRYAYHYLGVYQTDEEAALAPYDENAKGRTKHAGDAIWDDLNDDGYINVKDMVFMGYIRPDRLGGLTNEFRWKNLTARVVTEFAMGHSICNSSLGFSLASGRDNYNLYRVAMTDCWTPENTSAKYPRFSPNSDVNNATKNFHRSNEGLGSSTTGACNNTAFCSRGDYLAFREVSFAYNLPQNFVRKLHINGLQFFGGVYNLGYLTAYDGMTPEVYSGDDYGSYPRPREFSVGVNLSF